MKIVFLRPKQVKTGKISLKIQVFKNLEYLKCLSFLNKMQF